MTGMIHPGVGLLVIGVAELVLVIWGVVDAARRPAVAWKRAGQNKTLWVVLQLLGLVFVIGLVLPVIYLVVIRPSIRRAQSAIATPTPGT